MAAIAQDVRRQHARRTRLDPQLIDQCVRRTVAAKAGVPFIWHDDIANERLDPVGNVRGPIDCIGDNHVSSPDGGHGTGLSYNQVGLAPPVITSHVPEMADPDQNNAAQRIYLAIQHDVERGRLVPGQRLVEGDLAAKYDVGRNAVREAMQRLEGRGIVDLTRHRSAAIRQLSVEEMSDILDVAEALMVLLGRRAAANFAEEKAAGVAALIATLEADPSALDFTAVRRDFYRTMLAIAGNRELERLLPSVSMPILYAQCRAAGFNRMRLEDYRQILSAVVAGDANAAERSARAHVAKVRIIVAALE